MNTTLTTVAPDEHAYWLESVMAAFGHLSGQYRTDPRGIIAFGRVTAKFVWNSGNETFHATLLDTQVGSGCVGGDVITSINPRTESVNHAAARIHGRIVAFSTRLNATTTAVG